MILYKDTLKHCQTLEKEFDQIPSERKDILRSLSDYIQGKIEQGETPRINVICTHNSRRSHLGAIWMAAAANYYKLPEVETYSGGTAATAFNRNAVSALKRFGFDVSVSEEKTNNPRYHISWSDEMVPYQAFSKKYDDAPNPVKGFAAVMVCTDAEEACPNVAGAEFKLSIPFSDPKASDGTGREEQTYDDACRQIGREALFAFSRV